MAEGKRPGGLTALAVLNFVFGGLGALFTLGFLALLSVADKAASAAGANTSGVGVVYLLILLSVLAAILLIVSGIGYLGQKKFLGRTLGNAYAVCSLGSTGVGIAAVHTGFGIGTIIGLIYPVLTLILINTTFKDDLVN